MVSAPRRAHRSTIAASSIVAAVATLAALAAPSLRPSAGPLEFGRRELDRALAARGLSRTSVAVDLRPGAPEAWSISPGAITGGDERGLMYGLLEAADEIRASGTLTPASGRPATPMRGIRVFLHNEDLERQWYFSRQYWDEYFAMLARNRFNRFNLVFAHQTNYLAPPYPYWIALPEFPQIRVAGLRDEQRSR